MDNDSTTERSRLVSGIQIDETKRKRPICPWIAVGLTCLVVAAGVHAHHSHYDPSSEEEEEVCVPPMNKLTQASMLQNLENAAVASDHPICSLIGDMILKERNGNAIDAAVATTLCLGVVNPASSGIGGGSFMLIHANRQHYLERRVQEQEDMPDFVDARDKDDDTDTNEMMTEIIDAREVAPAAAYSNMFVDISEQKASTIGGLAVGVLGELRGLELAHARHGSLEWRVLVEPSVILARNGFNVSAHLEYEIGTERRHIEEHGMAEMKLLMTKGRDGKTWLNEGDLMKNEALAKTLERVMDDGADAIYTGASAETLAKEIRDAGGIITAADLKAYRPTLRSPLRSEALNGFTVVGPPPPSSGAATIIGILRFLLTSSSPPFATFADTLSMHRLVEGMRHAFAIRMSLGDPAFSSSEEAMRDLTQGDYISNLRETYYSDYTSSPLSDLGGTKWAKLHDHQGDGEAVDAKEGDRRRRLFSRFGNLNDHGTSHLSIVDRHGNAVSMTSSINTVFGSYVVSKSTGIVLNNQMDDFGNPGRPNHYGLAPSEANFIQPGKKPLSSMSPMLIFKDSSGSGKPRPLFMALGGSGGAKIITSVVQVLVNHILRGMSLVDAVTEPRIHDQLLYHGVDVTCVEKCKHPLLLQVSNRTRTALKQRGHRLLDIDYAGTVQAIAVDFETNTMTAVSDVRKGGVPAGY